MPRDPKRIRKFCNQLASAWETVPDLRFGQLIENVFDMMAHEGRDPFFPEEDEIMCDKLQLSSTLAVV